MRFLVDGIALYLHAKISPAEIISVPNQFFRGINIKSAGYSVVLVRTRKASAAPLRMTYKKDRLSLVKLY